MTDHALTRLRWKLTAVYFAVTLTFLLLVGGIVYGLIQRYFESVTDLSLRSRAAYEYARLGLPLPAELARANRDWQLLQGRNIITLDDDSNKQHKKGDHDHDDDDEQFLNPRVLQDIAWQMTALGGSLELGLPGFLVTLADQSGRSVMPTFTDIDAFLPHQDAIAAARVNGFDLRTVYTVNGVPVRLFTSHLPPTVSSEAGYLQVARLVTDQMAILRLLVTSLLSAGIVLAALATLGSWWLAGRSLKPLRLALESQQAFIANASHELRTPLALIQLSAEAVMRDDMTNTERQELAKEIFQESQYMSRLVSDLLLLSRLDADKIQLDLQPVLTSEVLAQAQLDAARLAAQKNVNVEIAGAYDGLIVADLERLQQVLRAILDNAIRHTPAGGRITLEAHQRGNKVALVITDTGEGIPPEKLPHVFERFYQADAAHTKGGAGLGLSIAKELIEAMGGTIALHSEVGRGTQVTIVLPSASSCERG